MICLKLDFSKSYDMVSWSLFPMFPKGRCEPWIIAQQLVKF